MDVSRRGFVAGGVASIAVAGTLDTLFTTSAGADEGEAYGYGPLIADPAGILDLPAGFSYKVLSAEGSSLGPAGGVVPGAHDGTGLFPGSTPGGSRLVRNHELGTSGTKAVAAANLTYDPKAFGGTSTVDVDASGNVVSQYVSIAGTATNCAGGVTPWGTWLTCEETEGISGQTKTHGWVFEVDPLGVKTIPEPIKPLGRFAHEAVCIDNHSHIAYLTEDSSGPFGLFYRFIPNNNRGGYHCYQDGGKLQAMRVPGVDDLSSVQVPGTVLTGIEWVDVPDPEATTVSVRKQFALTGQVTRSQKLEGAWFDSKKAYFVASYSRTSSGAAGNHAGQVWKYDPKANTLSLEFIFKPGGKYDSPDNITVSPYGGGVMLAEDGDGEQYLVGTTRYAKSFPMARNAFNDSEFTGVIYSEDRRTLFANRQSPGVTFAITGPFDKIRAR
ncbi:alkaline phosphatase PhoX [Actinocorallia longicatena]|uniref:PhoX family protein n=1 Tax=Actinocorallia longicatena TaxID=111803 RepID=A0ABP6QJB9_9ACTN